MKAELICPNKGFKPIVIQITIESKEEMDYIENVRSANCRIPELFGMGYEIHDKIFKPLWTAIKQQG